MFFHFPGGQLFYKMEGEGIPLLILHGFGVDHSMMEAVVEPVFTGAGQAACRIYIDLPGMGKSDPLPPDRYADDACDLLSHFMDELWPGQTYAVVSHSYGGYLARRLIHDHPERIAGSFFAAPVIHPMKEDRSLPAYEKRKTDAPLRDKYPELYEQFSDTAVVESEYAMEMFLKTIHPVLAGRKRENLTFYQKPGYACTIDVDQLDAPFDKPSVFFLGKQDHIVGYQDSLGLQSAYPRADFLLLDDAGHNLFFEQREYFAFSLIQWLKRFGLLWE